MTEYNNLIFELTKEGRVGASLPDSDVDPVNLEDQLPEHLIREESVDLPEVSELQVIRHYTALSKRNYSIDDGFYPLGSCTMKYNPKINEDVAKLPGFSRVHPYQNVDTVQGAMEMMYHMQNELAAITGMDEMSLQPAAGAQGEWAGLMMIRAYHHQNGEDKSRTKVIVPDSAHGTNPSSAETAGYDVVEVKSNQYGMVDVENLREIAGNDTAALMLTNPNTLGLFEKDILEITSIVHEAGGLLYYDGANSNAIMGKTSPGAMGFDVVHLNLHKTFTGPHGGGGPGAGPIGVKKELQPYLPVPRVEEQDGKYVFNYDYPDSIGHIKGYYGNFGIVLRAYTYIRTMGPVGLRKVSESAVLHSNYLRKLLEPYYETPYTTNNMHEFVLSGSRQKKQGVRTLDIAKRLLDFGQHPPTIYFPLVVEEGMMTEPVETETKESIDAFADAMIQIAKEVEEDPDKVLNAPYTTVVDRLDEATAARKPILRYIKEEAAE